MDLILDLKKNIEENAEAYFERSKKIRKKIEGAKRSLNETLKKLNDIKAKEDEYLRKAIKKQPEAKKEWYEKFRWFFSSEGFLVIGGGDATTNEIIIKKHTDKNDIVFHTDMAGSPFFVIKSGNRPVGKPTMSEAADATFSYSRGFKLGLSTTAVFHVKPEQVTKDAPSGEYLTKGSFMIKGKTNYVDNKANLAIGITKDNKVMGGPVGAVSKHCSNYVIIVQGNSKPSDCAKTIQKKIGGAIDDIIRALPGGNCAIK